MIWQKPGDTFTAMFDSSPGITATVGVSNAETNEVIRGMSGTGVYEIVFGTTHTGTFAVLLTAPPVLGNYVVTWYDGTRYWPEELKVVYDPPTPEVDPSSWAPSVAKVGSLLHQRTFGGSSELGTFTTETRPTSDQVLSLINVAISLMKDRIGGVEVPATLWAEAANLAAILTGMLVELSYFPDQVTMSGGGIGSSYEALREIFKEGLPAFVSRLSLVLGGEEDSLAHNRPVYSFPQADTLWSREL